MPRTARTDGLAQGRVIALVDVGVALGSRTAMHPRRRSHPLEHHPAFRAVIAAAPPIAELARTLEPHGEHLISALALACGDLASGFAAAPGTVTRVQAHHRAWATVRDLDRAVTGARIGRRAPARLIAKVQRAIDRADVLISALPGVLPA